MSELWILIPGLIDVPLQDLGGVSPLEKAVTPLFDAAEVTEKSLPADGGWEAALLHLLGASPGEGVAHGPLEALSLGYRLGPHQRAYSVRLLSSGERTMVDVSDELVSDSEGRALYAALPGRFLHLAGPRGVLITSEWMFPERVGCNPILMQGKRWDEGMPVSLAEEFESTLVGHEINEMRFDLEERPINGLLFYEGGGAPPWQNDSAFSDELFVTSSALHHGVARSLGMEVWRLPPEERRLSNVPALLEQLPGLLQEKARVVVDLPYLWQSTYEGNLREKVKTIEWLEREFLTPLLQMGVSCKLHPLRRCDIRTGELLEGSVPLFTMEMDRVRF